MALLAFQDYIRCNGKQHHEDTWVVLCTRLDDELSNLKKYSFEITHGPGRDEGDCIAVKLLDSKLQTDISFRVNNWTARYYDDGHQLGKCTACTFEEFFKILLLASGDGIDMEAWRAFPGRELFWEDQIDLFG